jgi:hypothetical protein
MADNPRFTAHMLVHWVGPPVAAFDLWEPLRTGLDFDRFDGFTSDDAEFVYEAAIEMLMDDPLAAHMKSGDIVVMSLAGVLAYSVSDGPDGVEHDMDVEIEWSHFRILNAEEVKIVNAEEFGDVKAADHVFTAVPLSTGFVFNVTPTVNSTLNSTTGFYQPTYIPIGNTGL